MTDVSLRHLAILRHMPRHPRKLEASEFTRHLHDLGFDCTKRTVERVLQDFRLKLSALIDAGMDVE